MELDTDPPFLYTTTPRKRNHFAKLFIWCLSKAVIAVEAMQRWTTQRAGREMGNEEGNQSPEYLTIRKRCPTLMITFRAQTGRDGPHSRLS